MKKLVHLIKSDFRLLYRYQIITIALLVTLIYIALFIGLGNYNLKKVLIMFIYMDPTMLGYLFTGALVLFEKSDRSLQALVVTPMKTWEYLWSKALSLTTIAFVASISMAVFGYGWTFNYFYFFNALVLTSILMVFLGIAIVARVENFNQYIFLSVLIFLPAGLPILTLFDITDTYWFYLFPFQASITLFESAFDPKAIQEIIFSHVFLLIWLFFAYSLAAHSFTKYIVQRA